MIRQNVCPMWYTITVNIMTAWKENCFCSIATSCWKCTWYQQLWHSKAYLTSCLWSFIDQTSNVAANKWVSNTWPYISRHIWEKRLRLVKFISGKSYIAHPVLYNLSRWWNGLESFAPVGTTLVYLHAASSPLYPCSSGVAVKCKYILCIWQSFRTYVGRGRLTLMVDTIEYKYPNGGKTQII